MHQQAADAYADLREQGLSAPEAREHIRLQYGRVIQETNPCAPLGARTGRFNCTRPNLSNPVLSHRRAA